MGNFGEEVGVRITSVMIKESTAFLDAGDDAYEGWWKDEMKESTIEMILVECEKIAKRLYDEGHYYYAGINLYGLMSKCHGWTEQEHYFERV